MPQAELLVVAGRLKGQRFLLDEGADLSLGRSLRADIQLPDQGISRLHCRVANSDGKIILTDLKSSNGTHVNGQVIQTRELNAGDTIAIGSSILQAVIQGNGKEKKHDSTLELVRDERPKATAIKRKYDRDTATISIESSDAHHPDLMRARKRLAAVCAMANTIYTKTSLQDILNTAVSTIIEITGADRGAIVMRNDDTGQITPVAVQAAGDEQAGEEGTFPVSRTIIEETLRQGVSVISSDASEDDRFKLGASVVVQKIHSVMCAPLTTQDRIIGAIYVDSSCIGNLFTESELEIVAAVGQQAGLAIERARLVNDLENLFVGSMHTLIAAIEAKDPYTRGHSERVTQFALMLATELNLDDDACSVIELSGVLHDAGKIAVPERILCKPDRLTVEEYEQIRKHPETGAHIIENMPEISRIVNMADVVRAVAHHHERWDGTGYPGGVAGEEIPLAGRILAVADTYDAVTSDRPYRKGRSPAEALAIITECAGTQFDPGVAKAFQDMYDRGMIGSDLEMAATGRFRIGHGAVSETEQTAAHAAAKGIDE